MIKFRFLSITFFLIASLSSYAQTIFADDFYMVSTDDSKMYRQSNDTLYVFKTTPDFKPFLSLKPSNHYKIVGYKSISRYHILKLEQLDTIPLSSNPYPLNRYSVLVISDLTKDTAGQLLLYQGLTKERLAKVEIPDLSSKFFSTLISKSYKSRLNLLKKIATKQDSEIIIAALQSKRYNTIVNNYKSTDLIDNYNTMINAELLYHACVDNGYNPINAHRIVGDLLKK